MNAPSGTQDPFSLLGVEPRFDLDLDQLAERHRELSRVLHPDRHAGAAGSERRQSLDRAVSVNAAWRRLKQPVSRAEALLERLGAPTDENSASKVDPELLYKVMEAREELAALRITPDAKHLAASIQRCTSWHSDLLSDLSRLFNGLEDDAQRLPQLQSKLVELRYCERLLEEAHNLEHESD